MKVGTLWNIIYIVYGNITEYGVFLMPVSLSNVSTVLACIVQAN